MSGSSQKQIAIVDYHMGNLLSVQRACEQVGFQPVVTSDKTVIMGARAVILPGVGAFGDAMDNLNQLDLVSPLQDYIRSGRPFLGICLGMQLLLSESDEFGRNKGLDIVKGSVVRFKQSEGGHRKIKVPQVGWNRILLPPAAEESLWTTSILKDVPAGEYMYFVHSYYAVPENPDVVLSVTTYEDITYCSGIRRDNLMAFQFHPEKSGNKGITLYRNFKEMVFTGGAA